MKMLAGSILHRCSADPFLMQISSHWGERAKFLAPQPRLTELFYHVVISWVCYSRGRTNILHSVAF